MAPIKKPGKAIVKWDEELANLAKDATKGMDLPTAKFISIRGGKLTFAGADVPGNELRCVILGWVHENQYYDGDFDPDVPQVPACYAFGQDTKTMEPHENAPDKQSDACEGCPINEFGSADRGKGKACKNVVRLAIIAESDLEDLDNVEIVYMKVPVMSVKNFLVYAAKNLKVTLGRPYWSVVTNISVVPDDKSQYRVLFELGEKIEDSDLFTPLKGLWQTTMEGIDFPYPAAIERKQAAPARGKAKAKPQKFTRR